LIVSRAKRLGWLAAIIAIALTSGFAIYWLAYRGSPAAMLTLYGNVDIREVQLAFNDSDRINQMFVQEGDTVHAGQLVAVLDDRRYEAAFKQARHDAETQQQVLQRLLNGSRPEEIERARADMEAASATLRNATVTYRRIAELAHKDVVSHQRLDDAERELKEAAGNYQAARQSWILAVKGPRAEDIENARETLAVKQAALALAKRELADTRLYAHTGGIIEDRILEPGDMASPDAPVFTIALTDPVWVRAYIPEANLGKIYLGMNALISTDSFPGKMYQGWVGYISPTAEFTPKTVETPELRTRLVYQVRVYACNPQNELRLGMPATVTINLAQNKPGAAQPAQRCGPGPASQPALPLTSTQDGDRP
jgi:HlyD family secretion protein